MTDRQKRFADEYLIDCNGSRAYKAAYPTVKNNRVSSANAARLLAKDNIRAYVDQQLAEMHNAKTADAAEVLEYLTRVMRGESTEEVVVVTGDGDGLSSAERVTKDVSARDRVKAAELLGKRYGIFSDRVQLTGPAKVVIVDDVGDDTRGG